MYLFITIKLLYILHATRQIVAYCKTEYKTALIISYILHAVYVCLGMLK